MHASEHVIHIDFSENYTGKHSSEIQSVHFGESHQQVKLHTGVLCVGELDEPITFCTFSTIILASGIVHASGLRES